MNKKVLSMTLSVLALGGAVGFLRKQAPEPQTQGFTATFVREFATKTGKLDEVNGEIHAVRANGDQSYQYTKEGNVWPVQVLTATKSYEFDPYVKLKSSVNFKQVHGISRPRDPSCETRPELKGDYAVVGHGVFMGLPVVKWRHTDPISAAGGGGLLVVEEWLTPSMGCSSIYGEAVKYDAEHNFVSSNRWMLVEIRSGEPDPALFDPPEGTSEVMPSQLYKAWQASRGLPVDDPGISAGLDAAFLAYKKKVE